MKTLRKIFLGFIFAFALVSCDNPVSLGSMLDLNGPDVNFTSPVPRKAVTAEFLLEGTAMDDSGVKMLLVKVEKDRVELPRQWRYSQAGWEISENNGVNWIPFAGAEWEGNDFVVWSIPISLIINGKQPDEGEYMFSATAWDKSGVSDDNSFKTLVLIIDNDPPKVNVINPLLFSRYLTYNSVTDVFNDEELEYLRSLSDWRNPEYVGKFQTNSFPLQWNIDDNFNIWSFDLRFYQLNVTIDGNPETELPDDYIYRFHQNLPPAPSAPSPEDYLKPNGSITIPALDGTTPGDGELKKQITDKSVIRIVAVCYDAANNVTQEKTLGYFIYWPEADIPWIVFSGDIKTPEYYVNFPAIDGPYDSNIEEAYLVYPGRDIKAVAFHAQGVKEVTYSLYRLEPKDTFEASVETLLPDYNNKKEENPLRGNNTYSTSFSWGFRPPPRSAFYVVKAKVLSVSGKESEITKVVFKMQDISFPDFPKSVQPPALEPLFKHISKDSITGKDSITINGIVSDATAINSLCLVWINPQSKKFAAMAQLEYFRDSGYEGWIKALSLAAGGPYSEQDDYDSENPNKVWKLALSLKTAYPNDVNGINPDTQRVEYDFSITIPLDDLNIGIGKKELKSQVFMLRAENPDNRVTIITYTPQGDEAPPVIKITGVVITHTDTGDTSSLTPGEFGQISKFKNGDKITINGEWREDSVEYLPFNDYLKDNFEASINQNVLPAGKLSFTGVMNSNTGTWKAEVIVGTDIPLTNLKDTLVIAANLSDIGGNIADDGASWLIESDTLRLVRISSDLPDQTYNAGKTIDIFIEFNKPVRLKAGRSNPVLNLKVGNGTATAGYKSGQDILNTKQYFTYNVTSGQNTTTADPWLDVTGLNGLANGNYWTAGDYPFTWEAVSGAGSEEIRITMNSTHYDPTGSGSVLSGDILLRRLPVAANIADSMYTLAKGKNIGIDTAAPYVTGVGSANKAGHYAKDAEIAVNIIFSEDVTLDESKPTQLKLKITNDGSTTVTTTGTSSVNKNTVTFTYKVIDGDTTGDSKVIVDSFTGEGITDIAGNTMTAINLTEIERSLNGGTANNGLGIYVNTVAPLVPRFRALAENDNTSTINNTINGSSITGESAGSEKDIKNYYGDELYFAVLRNTAETVSNRVGYFEYSLDDLSITDPTKMNWKRVTDTGGADIINGTPFKQSIYGKYIVRARLTDKAGNTSPVSAAVTLNWDPGAIVSRIDSSTPNGTYTNNSSRTDSINVTVYFRKSITVIGTPTVTLNVIRGTNGTVTVNGAAGSGTTSAFTYDVNADDNTPTGTGREQYLDVKSFNISARDSDFVDVSSFIKLPTSNDDKLGYRRDIRVETGALALSGTTNPSYSIAPANDEQATGTISLTFNRPISKRTGTVNITQKTAGYRLPAVLTEAQANRYKSAINFNTFYSRGTNGYVDGAVDATTKYILNYERSTVVTPNSGGTDIEKMAYDFLQAEKISLPVSSQDITVEGSTLTINISGSNTFQVLGATYDIVIPAGLVQDSLSFQWPATDTTYTYTSPGINRPFVRIDKKINEDRITATTGGGSATKPHLTADFSRLIQTRARLDCRTPNSVVRYASAGAEHTASAADSNGSNPQNPTNPGTPANYYWKNTNDNADSLTNLNGVAARTVSETGAGTNVTAYDKFTENTTGTGNVTHITVGTNTEQGYVWRIGVRSRNSTDGNINSQQYDEIAFRTVLTYEINGMANGGTPALGQMIDSGDQLWIRGGDAIGSSSIPNFPINWQDNYDNLKAEKKRAGVRLLKLINTPTTNLYTAANWRWITWEINVQTYHDVVLGRGTNTTTAQDANDAWQYGPRQWAYQRGGWSALKDQYTLIPGKHRWCRIITSSTYSGGSVNFSLQFSTRGAQDVSLTQPSP